MTSRPASRRPEFGLAMRLARIMLEHSIPSTEGSGWAVLCDLPRLQSERCGIEALASCSLKS